MDFKSNRPQGFLGKGDRYLPGIIRELKRHLVKSQRLLQHDTLHLSSSEWLELASVLVEFAEDIHNDIGIWKGLETYNLQYFETPHPVTLSQNIDTEANGINRSRIHHLLWVLYPVFKPGLIISPTHKDLFQLSELISDFLTEEFETMPRDSGVKKFLDQPNQFGWDIKSKLLWLGQHSYLFRNIFKNYLKDLRKKPEISDIDDFVCQDSTIWSGLGIVDILSATLKINEQQREDLRSWNERHLAYYKVISVNSSLIEAKNLISDKAYYIRIPQGIPQFEPQIIILGSLVPWGGEWYWSGVQHIFDELQEQDIQELIADFLKKAPKIVYRYCDQLAQKAMNFAKNIHEEFVKYHGDNLAVYTDGLAMAADMQRQYRLQYESVPEEIIYNVLKNHKLKNPWPNMSFPPELLENENGIGVFCNPNEGYEIMPGFNTIIKGLKKRGVNLTEDEADSIIRLIHSDVISPQFVRKLVGIYGDESIAEVFLIKEINDQSYLDYLLRRYKGQFYKNRYPDFSFH